MIRFFIPFVALAALLVPATAQAACGVPGARAEYETPAVQVSVSKQRLIACYRATGKARVVGARFNDGMGTDEFDSVEGLLGGRWLHTTLFASAAESIDVHIHYLIDLRTGKTTKATEFDEDTDDQVIALNGALVSAGARGVVARFTTGQATKVLSTAAATGLTSQGSRVFWREGDTPHTVVLEVPVAERERSLPRARTIGRCRPRAGAKLVLNDTTIVITRVGSVTWACRRGTTRRLGSTTTVSILTDREVTYSRAGSVGLLDLSSGKFRELESAGGTVAAADGVLVAGTPDGLRFWGAKHSAPQVISAEPAAEVALGESDLGRYAYWLDAGGSPRLTPIT